MKTMKTLVISALTVAALALSAGTALASSTSHDDGFDVFLQDQQGGHARSFLSGSTASDPEQGISYNGKWDREFRRVQGN
jgi:Tol biopolymer transport system component